MCMYIYGFIFNIILHIVTWMVTYSSKKSVALS